MYIAALKTATMRNHKDLPANSPDWLKNADIEHIEVTVDRWGNVSFRGVWMGGEWRGGVWMGGEWRGGVWRGGVWMGGVWMGGEWMGGVWRGGVWRGGVWMGGEWRGGVWRGGVWMGGEWRGGVWMGGVWMGGVSVPTRCKWSVGLCDDGDIRIGCKKMSVVQWDDFFAGTEVFETERGTLEFALIQRSYMAARAAAQFVLPT